MEVSLHPDIRMYRTAPRTRLPRRRRRVDRRARRDRRGPALPHHGSAPLAGGAPRGPRAVGEEGERERPPDREGRDSAVASRAGSTPERGEAGEGRPVPAAHAATLGEDPRTPGRTSGACPPRRLTAPRADGGAASSVPARVAASSARRAQRARLEGACRVVEREDELGREAQRGAVADEGEDVTGVPQGGVQDGHVDDARGAGAERRALQALHRPLARVLEGARQVVELDVLARLGDELTEGPQWRGDEARPGHEVDGLEARPGEEHVVLDREVGHEGAHAAWPPGTERADGRPAQRDLDREPPDAELDVDADHAGTPCRCALGAQSLGARPEGARHRLGGSGELDGLALAHHGAEAAEGDGLDRHAAHEVGGLEPGAVEEEGLVDRQVGRRGAPGRRRRAERRERGAQVLAHRSTSRTTGRGGGSGSTSLKRRTRFPRSSASTWGPPAASTSRTTRRAACSTSPPSWSRTRSRASARAWVCARTS